MKYVRIPICRTALKRNEGFTYIEALIGLSVMSVIVIIMPSVMKLFNDISLPEDIFDGDLFIIDTIEIYKTSEEILITDSHQIIFKTEQGEVKYRLYNDRIIKSINGKGFVTMMFNVDTFDISETADSYKIDINTTGGFNETVHFQKH